VKIEARVNVSRQINAGRKTKADPVVALVALERSMYDGQESQWAHPQFLARQVVEALNLFPSKP